MECQNCGETATINVQKTWLASKIIGDGDDYKLIGWPDEQNPEGEDNLFLCNDCYLEQFDKNIRCLSLARKWKWETIEEAPVVEAE